MNAQALLASSACRPSLRTRQTAEQRRRTPVVVVRANGDGPLREFREDTGEVKAQQGGGGGAAPKKEDAPPKFLYADEQPPPRDTMSPEMKARLRQEYYGLGGSPNQKMGNNYFLYICLVISFLAVLSKLTGAI